MIEIINRQRKHRIRAKTFRLLLEGLVSHYRLENPDVTLVFVGSRAIRTLNRKYMGRDEPTDVLSFPMGERGADGRFHLGDVVISLPVALVQSRRKGIGLEKELMILTIHGFLHLLGYDHSAGIEREEKITRARFLP